MNHTSTSGSLEVCVDTEFLLVNPVAIEVIERQLQMSLQVSLCQSILKSILHNPVRTRTLFKKSIYVADQCDLKGATKILVVPCSIEALKMEWSTKQF